MFCCISTEILVALLPHLALLKYFVEVPVFVLDLTYAFDGVEVLLCGQSHGGKEFRDLRFKEMSKTSHCEKVHKEISHYIQSGEVG